MRDLFVETEIPAASEVIHYDADMVELVRVTYVHPRTEVPVMKTCVSGPVVFLNSSGREIARVEGKDLAADGRHPWGYAGPYVVAGDVITVSVTRNA